MKVKFRYCPILGLVEYDFGKATTRDNSVNPRKRKRRNRSNKANGTNKI